jgi:hypothetical protein
MSPAEITSGEQKLNFSQVASACRSVSALSLGRSNIHRKVPCRVGQIFRVGIARHQAYGMLKIRKIEN